MLCPALNAFQLIVSNLAISRRQSDRRDQFQASHRSAEHPILDRDAPIDAEIVLKLAVIDYGDVGPDHDVLAEDAIAPDAASDRTWLKPLIAVPEPISTGSSTRVG
jgi:hypothetical protein